MIEYVKDKPDLAVDDMLWWLYETYKIVVGTRTIRRVFERKGQSGIRFKRNKQSAPVEELPQHDLLNDVTSMTDSPAPSRSDQYQSPYVPMASMTPQSANHSDIQLAQALQQHVYPPPPMPVVPQPELMNEIDEDEEMMKLELEKIALEKREVELKLKMKRLKSGKSPSTPGSAGSRKHMPITSVSTLYKAGNNIPEPPKRDSRSKKKIEEAKRRTADRQEKMLQDLERRSRRRQHLTAEWVQSKDIWPLRAQSVLANLMHQYGYYTYNQNNIDTFQAMFNDLYALVDHTKGDWDPNVHDELLRERMKRKMAQLRSKMQKTGEIIGRGDAFGNGWQRAENYTGQQAGEMLGDETETDLQPHDPMQAAPGALSAQQSQTAPQPHEEMHYEPVPDTSQQMQHAQLPYGTAPMLHHQQSSQYPLMDAHAAILPYASMPTQQGLVHQDSMGL